MANALTTQLILDGPRNCVVKIVGILDTSDVAPVVIVNPATLTGMDFTGLIKAAGLLLTKITYKVEDGLEVRLAWEATTPVFIEDITGRGVQDYVAFGGLPNNSGAGRTGSIMLSTEGWASLSVKSFTLVLEMVKEGKPHV